MTDEVQIIQQAKSGQRQAFEPIVRMTARLVWSHLMLKCRDPHRAEDLTQETFLRAWRAIASLGDATKLRPWLLSIADRVFLDSVRSQQATKRAAKWVSSGDSEEPADPQPGPAERVEYENEKKRLLDAIERLPDHYRQPLMLRYLAGLDYDAISAQLALTNGSLRGLLHRGLEILRIELSEKDELTASGHT